MSLAELQRFFDSRKRIREDQEKRKAIFDYTLADLIGQSVSRIYNSSNKMKSLSETYPSLFDTQEEAAIIKQKKDELSAIRFKQFANSFNSRFKEVAKEN
jgi:hypothetical protein